MSSIEENEFYEEDFDESSIDAEESEELYEHHNIIADVGQELLRIDKFLMDRIPNISRNKLQNIAKAGNLLVNGKAVKSNYKVHPKDEISVVLPFPVRETTLVPENIPIDIVYEDDDLVIVNKPPNMVVHPGFGNYSGTLMNALVYHFDNLPKRDDFYGRPGLVHRLDKHTTGLLVVAKTEYAMTHLSRQFFDRTSERRYYALVWGDVEEDEGTITGNIGRSQKNRKVFKVYPEDEGYGKHAVTHYKVIERFRYVTLVECKLETGRTHQIRVHFKHIGHPLFHDLEYGGDKIIKGTTFTKYKQFIDNCFGLIPGQALHAKTLGITHPVTGEWLHFDSELPEGMVTLLEKWRIYSSNVQGGDDQ
ncbi:RluA family pseudouridine synthase [Paracrocinitomix mangrovi]|uniref:RluA family pseudouridine synthase n=1 Tax=Paracrocinitomix mangrovi TaxID=2862509 RepID=UPI001C8DBC70|nr:RluA family pseudouridine synthase [Paracrocinitomix mangrovi]UKN01005.1 RluA family pseudouridine synthase [Paracrocinitomix mangrovi]